MHVAPRKGWRPIAAVVITAVAGSASLAQQGHQTLAPHEINYTDAPPAIEWSTPELPRGRIDFESAEERKLRIEVVANHLEQPWSIAFLPDGAMLITERPGRLRVVRNGRLNHDPVDGVPEVHTGGPRGLQGLMDVALHPRFTQNHWVYLTYHKPTSNGVGATTVMRGDMEWLGTRRRARYFRIGRDRHRSVAYRVRSRRDDLHVDQRTRLSAGASSAGSGRLRRQDCAPAG